jgi:hypothetical protein
MTVRGVLVCLLAGNCAGADLAGQASRLHREAQRAQRAGDVVRAYALYAQAAAFDPANVLYWLRSQALREQVIASARQSTARTAQSGAASELGEPAGVKEPAASVELHLSSKTHSFDLRGNGRELFEQLASDCGLEAVFDADYQPGVVRRFRLDETGCREALRALEAMTGSFVVPLGERRFLVANDTTSKRAELEPVVATVLPLPSPVALQEAQELARAVQQAMGLQQVQLDSERRLISLRGRVSLVRPAQDLLGQMLRYSGQVQIGVEFLELSDRLLRDYGISVPTLFPFINFSDVWNHRPAIPAGFSRFLVFGGGATFLGVGVTDASAIARMTRSSARTLLRAEIRSLDGQPASLHVGDRFPVINGAFLGQVVAGVPAGVPPSFTFEDLGLVLKVTPRTHVTREISLDLEAEFKVLTGQVLNRIPVIATRRLQCGVRLRDGQWAVIAGLMSSQEARTVAGLAGLSRIPVVGNAFRQNSRSTERRNVLLLLRPQILSEPPAAQPFDSVFVGSESRPRIPL